jgi:hypothetical protein
LGEFFVDALVVVVVVTTVRVSVTICLFVLVVEPVFVSKLSTDRFFPCMLSHVDEPLSFRFFPCMLSHVDEPLSFRNRLTDGIVCCDDPGVGGAVFDGWVVPLGSRLKILFEFFVCSFSGWW